MNYVTNTFLLVRSSKRSKKNYCVFARSMPKSKQKPATKNFVGFHNHFPPLTMIKRTIRSLQVICSFRSMEVISQTRSISLPLTANIFDFTAQEPFGSAPQCSCLRLSFVIHMCIENCVGKSAVVRTCVNDYLIWNKVFRPQMCRVFVSCADFEVILIWRRLVKLFVIVVSPFKRRERQTTSSITGQTLLWKLWLLTYGLTTRVPLATLILDV